MTVLIIGGGASGMAAALTAARAGHQVVLAERQARVGRKLLSTGNGRCNLTNEYALPDRYHGEEPNFCRFALEDPELSAAGTLDFFRQLGLVTVTSASRMARIKASSGVSSRPSSSITLWDSMPRLCARSSSNARMARAWPAARRASSAVPAGWF